MSGATERGGADARQDDVMERVRELVREARASCLWFLDEGFLPADRDEALRTLRAIESHGDRKTYVEARKLREWLSRTSSAGSAG